MTGDCCILGVDEYAWKALQTIADYSIMLNGYDDSHTIFFMRKLEDTIND
jgi:hypothetical protein